jgi:hypothetical protein
MSFCLHFTYANYWININPRPNKSKLPDRNIITGIIFDFCSGKRRSINFTICMVNLRSVVQVYSSK